MGSLSVPGTSMLTAAAARVMSFAPGGEMILLLEFPLNGNLDKITTRLPVSRAVTGAKTKE